MDTVPGALTVKENSKYLFGRGACDAKGSIASMVCACEDAAREGLDNFGILLDVDEEGRFSGVRKALRLATPRLVIVGEPTGLQFFTAQRGLVGMHLRARGRAAPGATPEAGVSAINSLVEDIARLNAMTFPRSPVLGRTTLNVGRISGGVAPNVVPDYAEALVELRTAQENKKVISRVRDAIRGCKLTIEYSFEPTAPASAVAGVEVAPYFAELFFWARKAPCAIFGPGEYRFAHTKGEKVRKRDLEKARETYLEIIRTGSIKERFGVAGI